MNYLPVVIMLAATLPLHPQTPKSGDDLKKMYADMPVKFYFPAPAFTPWHEGRNMLMVGEFPSPNLCEFVLLALSDTTLIGAFNTTGNLVFQFDTDGDGLLDQTCEYFLLPLWTVKSHANISQNDHSLLSVLNDVYEQMMQSDEGRPDEHTIAEYHRYQTDTTLANRHIALLFDHYQTLLNITDAEKEKMPSAVCLPLMKSLAGECNSLFRHIPAIVCVYMGETLMHAGMTDQARDHFNTSLKYYPNSIPLKVYSTKLETNKSKKKKQLAELKKNHGKHWMVKEL